MSTTKAAQSQGLARVSPSPTAAPTGRSDGGETASPGGGDQLGADERPKNAPLNNRELASLFKAQQARAQRLSGSGGGTLPDSRRPPPTAADVAALQKSPNCSTYHTAFNLREDHPEMFAE